MIWAPEEDADSLVESAMALVSLDGADARCPLQVFLLFGVQMVAMAPGHTHGLLSLPDARVYLAIAGDDAQVRWLAAHECGHLVLCVLGRLPPHDESLASRIGRALLLGRRYVLRLLEDLTPVQIAEAHADWMPAEQARLRVWEVQRTVARKVG